MRANYWSCSMPFDKWCEKFAELIVKECAEVMDKDMDHPYIKPGSILKHHFGVE
jgi:hypothetical protein